MKYPERFLAAMPGVFKEEGGYVYDPSDSGGETNFGISDMRDGIPDGLTDTDGDGKPDTRIKELTKAQAQQIFYNDYWLECACDRLPEPLDWMVFDAAIQHSPQLALRFLDHSIMGEVYDPESYLQARTKFYHTIVEKQPVKKKFLKTWLRRIEHNRLWIKES